MRYTTGCTFNKCIFISLSCKKIIRYTTDCTVSKCTFTQLSCGKESGIPQTELSVNVHSHNCTVKESGIPQTVLSVNVHLHNCTVEKNRVYHRLYCQSSTFTQSYCKKRIQYTTNCTMYSQLMAQQCLAQLHSTALFTNRHLKSTSNYQTSGRK